MRIAEVMGNLSGVVRAHAGGTEVDGDAAVVLGLALVVTGPCAFVAEVVAQDATMTRHTATAPEHDAPLVMSSM